jgi:hypothetical protein
VKDQQGRRAYGWEQERQGDLAEGPPPAGAQDPRCLLDTRVKVGPKAADDPDDDGCVVKDVGHQHQGQGVLQVDWRGIQSKDRHQPLVQVTLGPQERRKGRRHDHGRQDKGNSGQRPEDRLAPKVVAGKDIGRRHANQQRQQRREERLCGGEGQQARIVGIGEECAKGR